MMVRISRVFVEIEMISSSFHLLLFDLVCYLILLHACHLGLFEWLNQVVVVFAVVLLSKPALRFL
jgi:hypothetical protein